MNAARKNLDGFCRATQGAPKFVPNAEMKAHLSRFAPSNGANAGEASLCKRRDGFAPDLHREDGAVLIDRRSGAMPGALGRDAARAGHAMDTNPFWGPHEDTERRAWNDGWMKEACARRGTEGNEGNKGLAREGYDPQAEIAATVERMRER